jgi:hypothetical protein
LSVWNFVAVTARLVAKYQYFSARGRLVGERWQCW